MRAGTQASDEPCEFEQCLIDVVLPLDEHAMTQCRLAMLANALADEFFSGYVGFCSRSGHDISEVGGEVYRKSGRLWLAHFRRLAGRQLLSDGAERVDRQWWRRFFLGGGNVWDIEHTTDRAVTQFETRIVVRRFVREWRAGQNKTANTYVIEISL
jgi:hypothetical protein